MVSKTVIFLLLFLTVHISINFVLDGLKFSVHVPDIHVEGTVSQIFVLGLSFYFMSKNGQLCDYLFEHFFLKFIFKKRTRTYIKNLRQSSLHSDVFNTSVKFQV